MKHQSMDYISYYRVICKCLHHFKCLIVKIIVILPENEDSLKLDGVALRGRGFDKAQ